LKQINAQIVADSVNIQGDRITTYVLTYPRMIHAEVMTHRMFSRNAASSRAIPFEKMLKMVEEDPFIPIAWQKDHKGMQGIEYITDRITLENCIGSWKAASIAAIAWAKTLSEELEVTKQICNRLLEPFMWYTCLVTATEYDNFFELRCPKYLDPSGKSFKSKKDYRNNSEWSCWEGNETDIIGWLECSDSGAEIHIQALAEAMWDARNESEPRVLKAGEWHIPFGDQMDITINSPIVKEKVRKIIEPELLPGFDSLPSFSIPTIDYQKLINTIKVQVAIARCARLSYMTFEGKIDYKKDIELFEMLAKNKHASPFEHVAKAMSDFEYSIFAKHTAVYTNGSWTPNPTYKNVDEAWCNNIRGFIQYRFFLENEE